MLPRALALTALALAACSDSPAPPRTTMFGGDRPVQLYVPDGFDAHQKYPLVMVLHGYGANGLFEGAYLGIHGLQHQGYFELEPDGLTDAAGKQYWNADPDCCDFNHANPDDVGYLGGLLDAVTADWPVDRSRVMVVGHSNGGYMAYRLACERADVITDIAVLAGIASTTPCAPSEAVHVLHMHGTADDIVPYNGGGIAGVGAVGSVDQWASHDLCGTPRAAAGADLDVDNAVAGAETHREAFGGCAPNGSVELWTLNGSSHIPAFSSAFVPALLAWFAAHTRAS